VSKVRKFLNVDLFEKCRVCAGTGQYRGGPCDMCDAEGYAPIGMTLLEVERLRAAAKAEPVRPMLDWTAMPPTEPDHYWARTRAGPFATKPRLVTFRRNSDGDLRADYCGFAGPVEWWGPIPRPPEGKGGAA
jgi:hypothetical protein